MNYRDYRSITLNGTLLVEKEMITYCETSGQEYLRKAAEFFRDWLSDDPEITVNTSGSTGTPKAIKVQKNQMLASAAMTAAYFDFQPGQTALLALPIDYIAGKMMVVRAFYSRLDLYCIKPDSHPIDQIPTDKAIDFAPFVPMQVHEVKDTKSIRKILLGGGPIDHLEEERLSLLQSDIYHGYGMTETLSHIALRKISNSDKERVYSALTGVYFEQDEAGCLIIHVPFLEVPVITRDVVRLIDAKTFIWQGRADYVINSGGIKLFPEMIEQKLTSHIPEQFFIAGIPDPKYGAQVSLFIESTPYDQERHQTLISVIHEVLEKMERPRQIYYIPTFQRTESGKIQRKATITARQTD